MNWIVFETSEGKELCKITLEECFVGELKETKALLAYEKGISPEDIVITTRSDKPKRKRKEK